jgi:hypothetical protein
VEDDDDYDDGDFDWQHWTPCEVYGHEFDEYGRCECGEQAHN